ncbi:MAG: NAD(P)-dependent oxidoreductase [bacterium]|nr:NAD(P)-dependent oxidoreductase [bacterium]
MASGDADRPRVGVIGVGVMGGAMSGHLVAAGFEVCGYDVESAKVDASAATPVGSVAEVAARSDVVLLSLPSVSALEAVAAELADAEPAGLVAVEMGTLPLEVKQQAHDRLAAVGCDLLDAPVSGTGLQAADATLVVYSSGSRAGFERVAPLFDVIGRRTYHLGTFGNGTRMKFVANLLVAVHTLAAAEAHALGEAAGLDPALTQEAISNGTGTSSMFDIRGPMMVADSFDPPSARLALIHKDASIIAAYARAVGTETPLLDAAIPMYERGLAAGLGDLDAAALRRLFDSPPPADSPTGEDPRPQPLNLEVRRGDRPRVGVIGVGVMGGAMAGRLVAAGFEVCGYDVEEARVAASAATPAASVAEVAARSDVVLLSLPSASALEDVSAELAAAGPEDLLAVEMSTLPLEVKRRAHDLLAEAGCDLLDAPVSGTGLQAADAALVVYGSGSRAGLETAAPIFEVIGRRTYHLGSFGNGTRMKLVANLLAAVHPLAAAEAHALGAAAGLDPAVTQEVISAGVGTSAVFDIRGPMMVADSYEPPAGRLAIIDKDVGIITTFARAVGVETPLLDATRPLYRRGIAGGLGDLDIAAVRRLFESRPPAGSPTGGAASTETAPINTEGAKP